MKKVILFLIVVFIYILSCKENEPTAPEIIPTSKLINAENGGTVVTDDGFSLEIPEGALLENTEVTLTSFKGTDMHEWSVSSVHLEPDGLILEKPALLSFPLPSDWPIDHKPLIFISFDSDPAEYFNTGFCAEVISSEDGLFAQTEVLHFSQWGVIGNCHKGTLVKLLNSFKQRGCDDTTAWRKVKDKYNSVNTNITSNPRPDHKTLEAFLGVFFQDIGGFEKNESVENKWSEILKYIKSENRQVVVTFKPDQWGSKDGSGFYKGVAHSAIFDLHNGKLKLRNSISAGPKYLNPIISKNGENVIWFPSEDRDITVKDLDDFRNMRSYEAVEKELNNYPQLFSHFPPLENRKQPWTAIRFYVSNDALDENPCGSKIQFKYCDINFAVIETHDTLEGVWSPGWYTDGTFENNVFDGKISSERQGGNSTGTIRIEVDDNQNILSLNVMAHHSDPTGFSSQWGFTAKNIPPTENESYLLVYSYSGNSVCNYVKTIYAKYIEVDGSELELTHFKCDPESVLHIKFHNYD